MESTTCSIDGFGPLPVVRPASVAELGDIVRRAATAGQAIYPIGGQTQLGLGNPPTKPGIAVDMRGLDQVIEFPARDMTITVQAGITIAKLQALLAPENLRLPIDVPQPELATLGGILATNVSGPRRYGYGTLRDYVIGISAVNDEGHEFKAGGRVVKNVAGYDLCKLLIGSLGTLGIITQVTLKLRPLAEENALVMIRSEPSLLEPLLERWHGSRTRPVCLELLNESAARAVFHQAKMECAHASWIVIAGYEGNADAVKWQVEQAIRELGNDHSLDVCIDASAAPLWQALANELHRAPARLRIKMSIRPSQVVAHALAQADMPPCCIQAHAGNGIVWTHVEDLSRTEAVAIVDRHRVLMLPEGRGVLHDCPADWKDALRVWDPLPTDAGLMRAVKHRFDPRGLFNPGRFVDGL